MKYKIAVLITFYIFTFLFIVMQFSVQAHERRLDIMTVKPAGITGTPTAISFLPIIHKNAQTSVDIPTQTPTATLVPVTGDVRIVDIHYDGFGATEPDEFVEIKNQDTHSIQLLNWTLRDSSNQVFNFPDFIIVPEQICRVYTNQLIPESCGFTYGVNFGIWNNTTDCATLKDASDNQIDQYCYP